MKLIVWLWNPWIKYEKTRHNIWFTYINQWAESRVLWNWKFESKYKAELITTEIDWEKLVLCKPQTYMNLSWEAVSPLAKFYKISWKDILVIHDEIDLPIWTVKLKFGWWLAGHNWLRDIALKLWTQDFWRIRVGVDRPGDSSTQSVADYVLWNFRKEQIELIKDKYLDIERFIFEFLEK